MPSVQEFGKAGQTVFTVPRNKGNYSATVNGSGATIASSTPWQVTLQTAVNAGDTVVISFDDPDLPKNYRLVSAATTNATSVTQRFTKVLTMNINNDSASKRYIKVYDKATAPTVGTDVPIATFIAQPSFPYAADLSNLTFLNGFALAITGARADTDTTAVAVGDITLDIQYL